MLNKYPLWKNLLIVLALIFACLYAAPNLYPPDAAIQVTPARSGAEMSEAVLTKVRSALQERNIEFFGEEVTGSTALFRLTSNENQLPAKDAVQRLLGDEFIVALNLAPTTPDWLLNMGAGPMTLGLDLSGGVHFLMEVDMDDYVKSKIANYREEFRNRLREEQLKYRRIQIEDHKLRISFVDAEVRAQANSFISRTYPEFLQENEDKGEYADVVLAITEAKIKEFEDYAIKQNLTTLRNRVNELGVAEPLVQRQGRNRIVVELPGVQDTAEAKKILGKAANLEFRLEAEPGASRFQTEEYAFRNEQFRTARLEKAIIATGDSVTNAQPSFDENGSLNYWTARRVDDNPDYRYINAKVPKTQFIVGELDLDWSAEEIVLVEGPTDLIKCSLLNATCLLGSTLRENSELFRKLIIYPEKIILALDADARKKQDKIASLLMAYDKEVYWVPPPPDGYDWGDLDPAKVYNKMQVKYQYTSDTKLINMIKDL